MSHAQSGAPTHSPRNQQQKLPATPAACLEAGWQEESHSTTRQQRRRCLRYPRTMPPMKRRRQPQRGEQESVQIRNEAKMVLLCANDTYRSHELPRSTSTVDCFGGCAYKSGGGNGTRTVTGTCLGYLIFVRLGTQEISSAGLIIICSVPCSPSEMSGPETVCVFPATSVYWSLICPEP